MCSIVFVASKGRVCILFHNKPSFMEQVPISSLSGFVHVLNH